MPIFEYRCGGCRRKFSLLVGVVAGGSDPRCPTCGSEVLQKLISRFAVARSEDDLMDDLADPSKIGDMEDPRQMVQWMKRMGKEMGEDLGDDFDELVEEAAREEADGESEAGGESLDDASGAAGGLDDL
jgi:putative FmdB family regulatory protein